MSGIIRDSINIDVDALILGLSAGGGLLVNVGGTGSIGGSCGNTSGDNVDNITIEETDENELILPARLGRVKFIIKNNSNKKMFIAYGKDATTDDIEIDKDGMWIEEKYTGDVYGIWDKKGKGDAKIVEIY